MNGDGSAVREFTHVVDVATAVQLALHSTAIGEKRAYTVGSGTTVSMHDLVTRVAERTGRPIPVDHRPPKPEAHTLVADSTRIRTELGWQAPSSALDQIIDDAWGAVR